MGLKPDHWIRKMAQEHAMITPFEDRLVREGVISYGLSSYGYDIRVSNEFKIFTPNPYNTIVDPKHLDERSLMSYTGDVCIIPPNSFALAVTVEYFRVPRDVLTLTVGKSTYARCFSGDTRVALVDGSAPTLEDMAIRADKGEMFWGYSLGEFGRIITTLLDSPRYIGQDSLLEIRLDNQQVIQCTPDHEFILRDGRTAQAHMLRPNDALMPLYRNYARGYEMIYQPINGHLYPTHRLSDEWNIRNGIYSDLPDSHRHHKDYDRLNNNPWNLERMNASDHIRLHNQKTFGEDFDPEAHGLAVKAALEKLKENEDWYAEFRVSQRKKIVQFWSDPRYAEARERMHDSRVAAWTTERRAHKSDEMREYHCDPAHREHTAAMSKAAWSRDDGSRRAQQAEIIRELRTRSEITAETVRQALDQTGSIRGAARALNCDRAVFRRFPEIVAEFNSRRTKYKYKNHTVESIRELPGDHAVFCLTVPEAGNFALEAGVFVRNCGIITNVTPFEPGWEGYVTLEISNTTPLPAKIYAGEGIAQVLFFEADEPCEVSYDERKGKYQGQQGIVLPKV